MILDTTAKVIQVVLAEAKVTNDCEVNGCWADTASGSTFVPAASSEVTNGTTAVTVIAAPASSTQRAIKELSVYNADTVPHFVTVRLFDGTNTRRIVGWEIPAGDTLYYSADSGWAILPSSSGAVLGANPTATAGPAAVNGSALTFMRSDGAPAVQTATTGQLGLVKPDGTTITISGGTISSVGGATGANPTATAGATAINGTATTFMRSDGAPAVAKASSTVFGIVEVDNATIKATAGVIAQIFTEPTYQDFTTTGSSTYTPTSAAVTRIEVWMKAAGGGGLGNGTGGGGTPSNGAAASFVPVTGTVTALTAIGGLGAVGNDPPFGGSGGANGTGWTPANIRRLPGAPGGSFSMLPWSATAFGAIGGSGGGKGGGHGSHNAVAVGAAVANSGGGGAGNVGAGYPDVQANVQNYAYANGGGEGEEVMFDLHAPTSVSATFTIIVPAGGGGGIGTGTNAVTGGPGASGFVRIKEFYD